MKLYISQDDMLRVIDAALKCNLTTAQLADLLRSIPPVPIEDKDKK